MGEWWNSVESVGRVNTLVLAFAAALGFIAALLVAASWFTGTRLAYLQDTELDHYKKDADVRIANANESAAKANEAATQSKAASDAARVKQLEIERENKELQLRVEQEKRARLEIERKLADRHISVDQAAKIKNSLTPLSGHRLQLNVMQSTPEAISFAAELESTLASAGLKITRLNAGVLAGGPPEPLSTTYGKNRREDANAIGVALLLAGVTDGPLPAYPNPANDDDLQLTVRPK